MHDEQTTISATVTNSAGTNDVIVDLASGDCVSGEAMDADTAEFFGAFAGISAMMAADPDITD